MYATHTTCVYALKLFILFVAAQPVQLLFKSRLDSEFIVKKNTMTYFLYMYTHVAINPILTQEAVAEEEKVAVTSDYFAMQNKFRRLKECGGEHGWEL